jgi:hypothetical protein
MTIEPIDGAYSFSEKLFSKLQAFRRFSEDGDKR